MLSVLTVQKVGSKKCIEMFHSSPEGGDLCYLMGVFLFKRQLWQQVIPLQGTDLAVLRDGNNNLWVAESQIYDSVCYVETNG